MILNEKYNQEDFNFFLNDFLPEDFKPEQKDIELDSRCKTIKSAQILGRCESIGLYVLELSHEKERDPRVTLANEAFKIMADAWAKKALVVFRSGSSGNWRLSYMTITLDIDEKNKVVQNFSNPRRKSFYLGPDARIATPKKYLFKSGRVKTIEELESCFDVEVVTKEFFENYRKLFNKLSAHLKEDKAFAAFAGNNSIKLEDFAKKLLGQIVFIYFLQKKGWLGAKKEQHIYEGDPNFLRNLIIKCESEGKNFFNNKLEPLFYNAFNNEPERAGNFYREYFDCQIPFLNGGLFEPLNNYDWERSFLHIPNELFSNQEESGILDIFDLYNFTIDENSPVDQEVSVDPEMLGKVFEKLLDTNKETGSFYTPREIVSYMVKQSLIEYLKTKTDIAESKIEELVNNHQAHDASLDKKSYEAIEKALKEIKIIDPAVGSGAFPVGILQEMTAIRLICQSHRSSKPMLAYDIKKEILENNIYGVDIDHGAIDIARLRFWLSLVVDADLMDVEPLPNLDFKLVAANTLLKLDGEAGLYDEKDLLDKMKELREKYFRARSKTSKEKIQSDYKKLISRSNHMFATDRQRQITTYDPFSPSSVAQFFDPEYMFGIKEFNLTIGNPPYVRVDNIDNNAKEVYKKIYSAATGKYDLYYLFFQLGKSITAKEGSLSYITPNKYCAADSGLKLREFIFLNNDIEIVSTSKLNVFKDASNYPIITFVKRAIGAPIIKVREAISINFLSMSTNNIYTLNSKELEVIPEKIIPINCSQDDINVIMRLLKNPLKLTNYISFSEGLRIKKEYEEESINDFHIVKQYQFKKWYPVKTGSYISRINLAKVIKESSARYKKMMREKILIAEDALEISATIDGDKCIPQGGVYFGHAENNYFILGILNSKLFSWMYKILFGGMHMGGGYLRYRKNFLELLPMPSIVLGQEKIIAQKSRQIIETCLCDNEIEAKKTELELEINELVFSMFDLNDTEKKIINR